MKISVVITAYNEEKSLPQCITAVNNQSFPKEDFEIIVVDNNSKDKTAEIAKSLGARVIKEQKQGYVYALSKGMDEAKGEIVAVTDSDTIVPKDWLGTIDKAFNDEKVVAVTGIAEVETKNVAVNVLCEKLYELFLRCNFLIGKPHLTGFNLAVRKKAFDQIGGLDEKFVMSPDVDLGLRMSKIGKVIFISKMRSLTSIRRWQEDPLKAFWIYSEGYLWSAWFRKPPPVRQNVIR